MTTTVTDTEGREWHISLTLQNIRNIKKDLGIDLGDVGEHGGYVAIANDREKLGTVFWYLIEQQAKRQKVTEDELANALDGSTLDQATLAIRDAYVAFCPPHQRGAMARMFKRVDELAETSANRAADAIESDEIEKKVIEETDRMTGIKPKKKRPRGGGRSTTGKPLSDLPAGT